MNPRRPRLREVNLLSGLDLSLDAVIRLHHVKAKAKIIDPCFDLEPTIGGGAVRITGRLENVTSAADSLVKAPSSLAQKL